MSSWWAAFHWAMVAPNPVRAGPGVAAAAAGADEAAGLAGEWLACAVAGEVPGFAAGPAAAQPASARTAVSALTAIKVSRKDRRAAGRAGSQPPNVPRSAGPRGVTIRQTQCLRMSRSGDNLEVLRKPPGLGVGRGCSPRRVHRAYIDRAERCANFAEPFLELLIRGSAPSMSWLTAPASPSPRGFIAGAANSRRLQGTEISLTTKITSRKILSTSPSILASRSPSTGPPVRDIRGPATSRGLPSETSNLACSRSACTSKLPTAPARLGEDLIALSCCGTTCSRSALRLCSLSPGERPPS